MDEVGKYLRSEEFRKSFAEQVRKDTWGNGLPMVYLDRKTGNIVEHWEDGTINILHTKEELKKTEMEERKEYAKDQLIELYENQIADLVIMSKIELGNDVIAEIKRLKEIINEE